MSDYLCLSKEEVNKKFFEFIEELKDPSFESKANPTHFCEENGNFRLSDWWKEVDKFVGEGLV